MKEIKMCLLMIWILFSKLFDEDSTDNLSLEIDNSGSIE